jgi:hypothetical protein
MGTASEPAASPPTDGTCPECGFDYDGLDDADIPDTMRAFGRRYQAPLTRGLPDESLDDLVRAHPLAGWSALEYACHVRDVFAVQRERVQQALAEDMPAFGPMGGVGREEMARRERYNDQDPAVVADELAGNASALAETFELLTSQQWERRCIYNYPEPIERDLRWLARHTVHEGRHHLLDIGRVLRAARGR